ncbi:receptor like protein kinase S.2-like [Rutidosis leptorrhynchoides]|uniref:receptor like protein kinase S.2-like n=1 Tax=Rutidosis leptorrhynchoides TaxID=125765 RepID=UPI003A996243
MASHLELEHLRLSLADIKMATENFTSNIGRGGYGDVYKGELALSEGLTRFVTVKRLVNKLPGEGHDKFLKEIQMLSGYNHRNLVSLLGYYDESTEKILIYEYEHHSSLDKYLDTVERSGSPLTWKERLIVCIDAARSFDYLRDHFYLKTVHHSAGSSLTWKQRLNISINAARDLNYLQDRAKEHRRVVDRDIKSSNVQRIDNNWKAMIAGDSFYLKNGYGKSRYGDPEFIKTGVFTKESNVYSFGVVLFEVLCGRLCFKPNVESDDRYFPQLAQRYYREGKLNQIIDPNLSNYMNTDSMKRFSRIAYQCLLADRAARPSMDTVLQELKKALEPLIGLQVIDSATSNFSDENLIQKDKLGKFYKGKMLKSGQLTDIIARRVGDTYEQTYGFWTEISMLHSLKHKNIVSIAGICDENGEKIIIYEQQTVHGHLDRHLTDATNLTWTRRLKICLGVAQALDYLHCDVIHCDVNCSKIFLDEDWEPKIFGFEHSTTFPGSWRHRLLSSQHFNTSNYRDPTYIDTAIVTPKYDVYSFGVMLFDVLCGRKASIKDGGVDDQSLPEMAKRHFADEKLDEIIDKGLRKQMDLQSLKIFSDIAYRCCSEEQLRRPSMDQVVKELGEAIEHQWKHENVYPADADEATSSNLLKREDLERMKIPLADIISATNNFDESNCIGEGGYGKVYKAFLEHFDIQSLSSKEEREKKAWPKKRSTVAIKRMMNRQDDQGEQGFWAELKLLTSCNHCNIVSLLGFSSQNKELILVYEFLINGSLGDYLSSAEGNINLNWCQRIQLCLDIAEGLKYLHTNMEGKPRIIHRDIKSDNVLLDKNCNAKIADFGLSKFHPKNHLASTIRSQKHAGTEVYMDPEYATTGRYKKESDVYSFGVVLFEILSGRLAYDSNFMKENNKGLAPIARRRFNEKTLKELID